VQSRATNTNSLQNITTDTVHVHTHEYSLRKVKYQPPRAGSMVVGIDPLCFLAGCRKRRLNQALSVLSLSLGFL